LEEQEHEVLPMLFDPIGHATHSPDDYNTKWELHTQMLEDESNVLNVGQIQV
jgi:hypothetical protein